jgi:hypothetical protein
LKPDPSSHKQATGSSEDGSPDTSKADPSTTLDSCFQSSGLQPLLSEVMDKECGLRNPFETLDFDLNLQDTPPTNSLHAIAVLAGGRESKLSAG